MSAILVFRSDWRPALRPLPEGEAIAAIGDVHGHDDLFGALMDALGEEMSGASRATFVQLGDLVDRGPDSRGALKRAKAGLPGATSVTLMGNHEDRMLRAAFGEDSDEQAMWLDFGGRETLESFGFGTGPGWPGELAEALISEDLATWLGGLPKSFRLGQLLFVHAGIDPQERLDAQQPRTLMWMRRPFLDSPGPYPEDVGVLHGHTPTAPVELGHPHRINLDTGAYRTGVLSGLVISGDRMRLLQAMR